MAPCRENTFYPGSFKLAESIGCRQMSNLQFRCLGSIKYTIQSIVCEASCHPLIQVIQVIMKEDDLNSDTNTQH